MSLEMLTVHLDILLDILIIAIIFIGGLFTKHYLPTYMDKKGENLATKEDVEEITKLTEQFCQKTIRIELLFRKC